MSCEIVGAGRAAPPAVSADLVVVGSGVAGLSAALEAARQGARVLLLTGGEPLSGTYLL